MKNKKKCMNKCFYFTLIICVLLIIFPNCEKDNNKDNYDPTIYTGYWTGTTSQNLPITFRVNEEGKIDNLVVRIRMSFGQSRCITDFFMQNEDITIENNKFYSSVKPNSSMGFVLPISFIDGNFSTNDSIRGEFDGYTGSYRLTCDDHFVTGTGELFSKGIWVAHKNIIVVDIESPLDNSIISGTIDINVNIKSFNEITQVEFYIDNIIQFTDTSSPYSYSWNTNQFSNGIHVIKVIVYDNSEYIASNEHDINVNNSKWEFTTSGGVKSSPAIGSDGTIYVGSCDDNYVEGHLYAINPDGTKKWEFETGNDVESSPAIGSDGTIYVGSDDDKLYAINPDGTKKWEFLTDGWIESSPAIGSDGTIYVGSWDEKLYAINPDGTKKWEFVTGNAVMSSPALDSDGTIYIGSWDDKLYAINPDGTKKWEFETSSGVKSSPAIGSDRTIYVGSIDNKLYAINPDGTKKWEFVAGGGVYSSPAIGSDGTIYVGSSDDKLYAINPDGTKKWEFLTDDNVSSSPAIGSDGTIYIGSWDEKLYAINPDGTKKWEFVTGERVYSSPAIGSDGTIYVGSWDDKLYALDGTGSIGNIPWPMFHHDLQHTGRQE